MIRHVIFFLFFFLKKFDVMELRNMTTFHNPISITDFIYRGRNNFGLKIRDYGNRINICDSTPTNKDLQCIITFFPLFFLSFEYFLIEYYLNSSQMTQYF